MSTSEDIERAKQKIARLEKCASMEKLKKRRADTRRKIEFGGLVIKAGMDGFNKSVILGALLHAMELMGSDETNRSMFESMGDMIFLNKTMD